jgi:hypothetical protein
MHLLLELEPRRCNDRHMPRLRTRRALCGGAIIATAVVACALPAASATGAPPPGLKTFRFAIPLPKANKGKVVLLTARVRLPSNMRVSGNVLLPNVTNGPKLPCYIRAAAATFQTAPGTWRMFVAINAPKAKLKCDVPFAARAGATNMDMTVQITPPAGAQPSTMKQSPGDACKQLKQEERDRHTHESGQSLLGSSPWKEIRDRAEESDYYCG